MKAVFSNTVNKWVLGLALVTSFGPRAGALPTFEMKHGARSAPSAKASGAPYYKWTVPGKMCGQYQDGRLIGPYAAKANCEGSAPLAQKAVATADDMKGLKAEQVRALTELPRMLYPKKFISFPPGTQQLDIPGRSDEIARPYQTNNPPRHGCSLQLNPNHFNTVGFDEGAAIRLESAEIHEPWIGMDKAYFHASIENPDGSFSPLGRMICDDELAKNKVGLKLALYRVFEVNFTR